MINKSLLKKMLDIALKELQGDWIIIGGTVLPLIGVDHRVTLDIDMIHLDLKNSLQQNLKLMDLAEKLGLPVEAINQSGIHYLNKVKNFRQHLVVYQESKNCRIYIPNSYLYLRLKSARMSETDLKDCYEFLKKYPLIDQKLKRQFIKEAQLLMQKLSVDAQQRLSQLVASLKSS